MKWSIYNFIKNNKTFINENLTWKNESTAFCGRKLKQNGMIYSCYSRDGWNCSHIKTKYLINFLYDTLPGFEFFKDDGSELFHDAWPNISGQSSYWSDQIKIVVWY